MRDKRIWRRVLGVEHGVFESIRFDEEAEHLIAAVRVHACDRHRCSRCRRRCGRYDRGRGRRRWRTLDLGTYRVFLEADLARVRCPDHGIVVAWVPWARVGSRLTRSFEDQVTWLATHTDRTTVSTLMRIVWRTVARTITRVCEEARGRIDLLDGLTRIGIDEVSHRKGQRYLVVVVDHDTGRLVWAGEGRNAGTVRDFFRQLGLARCAQITHISADGASWIEGPVRQFCPGATLCLDPFHVMQWTSRALDDVRREAWNTLRRQGDGVSALALKRSRFALWKAPENLTPRQQMRLSEIEKVNRPLYRAYLLKEHLRETLSERGPRAVEQLDGWLAWAARSRLPRFVQLGRQIRAYREQLVAALTQDLTNARTEGVNTKLRLLHRLAFGFHSAEAFISIALLRMGKLCPPLPGRG